MEKCTVGRNNAKPLWRECGKWSMVRVVALKLMHKTMNMIYTILYMLVWLLPVCSEHYCDWPLRHNLFQMFMVFLSQHLLINLVFCILVIWQSWCNLVFHRAINCKFNKLCMLRVKLVPRLNIFNLGWFLISFVY